MFHESVERAIFQYVFIFEEAKSWSSNMCQSECIWWLHLPLEGVIMLLKIQTKKVHSMFDKLESFNIKNVSNVKYIFKNSTTLKNYC